MASKRNVRKRKCGHKQRHATQAQAIAHAQHVMNSGKSDKWLTPYRCRFCGYYHIGQRRL